VKRQRARVKDTATLLSVRRSERSFASLRLYTYTYARTSAYKGSRWAFRQSGTPGGNKYPGWFRSLDAGAVGGVGASAQIRWGVHASPHRIRAE